MKSQKNKQIRKYRSVGYKVDLVLELLRGEPKSHIARREGLTVSELSNWHKIFINYGKSGFKSKAVTDPSAKELKEAKSLIADQAMELALYKKKMKLLSMTPEV